MTNHSQAEISFKIRFIKYLLRIKAAKEEEEEEELLLLLLFFIEKRINISIYFDRHL
jgi:hypothetical protein